MDLATFDDASPIPAAAGSMDTVATSNSDICDVYSRLSEALDEAAREPMRVPPVWAASDGRPSGRGTPPDQGLKVGRSC